MTDIKRVREPPYQPDYKSTASLLSNIPPNACELWPLGPCVYLTEPHHMYFSLVMMKLTQRKYMAERDRNQGL
jgi:hypothetical protein